MTHVFSTVNDQIHISKDKKTIIGSKQLKKSWIQLPKQLGGVRSNVLDQFVSLCQCGKHTTTVYILNCKFVTMYCNTAGQWAWILKPSDSEINQLKEMSKDLIK